MEVERPISRLSAAVVVILVVSGLLYLSAHDDIERIDPELLAAISAIAGAAGMYLWSDRKA